MIENYQVILNNIDHFDKCINKCSKDLEESYDLIDLFETKALKSDHIKKFIHNDDNEEYIQNFINKIDKYINDANNENKSSLKDFYYEIKNLPFNDENKKIISFFRNFIKNVCRYAILYTKDNVANIEYEDLNCENFYTILSSYKEKENTFYRGQSDYTWGLIPSFFRNYNFNTNKDGEVVNLEKMYQKYLEAGLVEKYNGTIAKRKINDFSDLDYDFMAYMQHSIAYSPLIDITSKFEIGVQFALGNKSDINNFRGKLSTVFVIDAAEKDNNNNNDSSKKDEIEPKGFEVIILKKKIVPGTIMSVENSDGRILNLNFTTIPNIIEKLTPEYTILSTVKNDRMKYQHGSFILFYDYVLVLPSQTIIYTLNKSFKFKKIKIKIDKKDDIYGMINEEFPQYNMDYLMNPYDYFNK